MKWCPMSRQKTIDESLIEQVQQHSHLIFGRFVAFFQRTFDVLSNAEFRGAEREWVGDLGIAVTFTRRGMDGIAECCEGRSLFFV